MSYAPQQPRWDWWPEDSSTTAVRLASVDRGRKPGPPVWPEPGATDPAIEFEAVTLPRMIAEGLIEDRGEDYAAKGFGIRYSYTAKGCGLA